MTTLVQAQTNQESSKVFQQKQQSGIEEIFEEINHEVENVQEKVHHIVDDYEQKIVEVIHTISQYKDQVIQKSKNSKIAHQADDFTNTMLSKLEKQVDQLNNHYQQNNVDEKQSVQKFENQSIPKRVKHLIITLSLIFGQAVQNYWQLVKESPLTQKLFQQLALIKANPKVREFLIFTDISREFLTDLVQTRVLTPAITCAEKTYSQLKYKTEITLKNTRVIVFKQFLPKVVEQYKFIKNSSIEFYNDKVTIKFAQEYYQSNKQLIQKELKEFYSNFIKYQENQMLKYKGAYTNALQSYKQRRMKKLSKFDRKRDEINSQQNSDKDTNDENDTQSRSPIQINQ